jgi:AcrR family transcriptional regulator
MYAMSTLKKAAYHHGQLRETLLGLALEMLTQIEPEQLTLRGLAEKAGVSSMAPYRHFVDKAALMTAVAEAGFAELRERLVAVDDEAHPKKALIAFGATYVGFACEKPNLYRAMFAGAPPTTNETLTNDGRTVFGLFTARLAQIVDADRRQDAFLACWSLAHGLASLAGSGRIRQPVADPSATAARLGALLLEGLLAREAEIG